MSTLIRWKPSRDLMTMRNEMDRLMESFFSPGPVNQKTNAWGIALDITEDEQAYQITASVPGIKGEDLNVTFDEGVLNIQGEINQDSEENSDESNEDKPAVRYHVRERRVGRFSRSVRLPNDIDADNISANHADGILTLTLPKAEAAKPRRIEIG